MIMKKKNIKYIFTILYYIYIIYIKQNIVLSLRNENATIKDELEKLQRYYSGLNHSIETSSPIFKRNRDSEMEVLLEKVSLSQKKNEKMRNLLDIKVEENNQLKNELANLHLEHEDLKLKYNQQQQQLISLNEGGEKEIEVEDVGEDDDRIKQMSKLVKNNRENEELMKENEKLNRQIQEFTDENDKMKVTLSKLINKVNQLSIIKDENDELKTQLRSTTKSSSYQTGKAPSPTIQKIKLNSVTDENEDLKIQLKKDEKYIQELQEVFYFVYCLYYLLLQNVKYYQQKYDDLLSSYHIMVKQYKAKSPSTLSSSLQESKDKSVLEDIYMYLCQLYKCCDLECPKRLVSYENITPLLASIVPIIKARLQKALDLEEAYNYKLTLISKEHSRPRRVSIGSPSRRPQNKYIFK